MTDVRKLIAQMTLEEKAGLCSGADFWHLKGVERLGIPSVMVTDGPHGLRKQTESSDHIGLTQSVKATCFPAACLMACSFDRALAEEMGETLGAECQAENVSTILGPGTNIKRSPLCGRNFEYFSEDPMVAGEMAAAQIRGVQRKNVGTSLKHYAVNNQETRRMSVNVKIDERTYHEIYLRAFEIAVRNSKPWTVMCSYNKVNGVYMSQNPYSLTELLRDAWGFDGYTVTDWGACCDHVKGVLAGLDLEMPSVGTENDRKLAQAVRDGVVPMETLDRAVERILTVVYRYLDNRDENAEFHYEADHHTARRIARESMVLLRNEESILPIKGAKKVAFIGQYAREPRYQGSGSSRINPSELTSAVDAVRSVAKVAFAEGFKDGAAAEETAALRAEAVETARGADIAVLFLGLPGAYESEGYDRSHMRMPEEQIALLDAVHAVNGNIVVVLHNGSPVEMPWIGKTKAVLEAYLGGQAVGGAVVDLLFGAVNPCGKLPETFPLRLEDNPSYLNFPGTGDEVVYSEGVYVGYRYYDKKKMDVLFPFGFGLSYTTYEYANLRLSQGTMKDGDTLTVTCDVTNTGKVAGKEIVQLYVAPKAAAASRPVRELRGFEKVALEAGETKAVTFTLHKCAFAYYEPKVGGWYAENGAYDVEIGASSRDIRLCAEVVYEGARALPVEITKDTTFGDILAVKGAKEMLAPIIQGFMQQFGMAGDPKESAMGDAGAAMIEAVLKYLPVHSLRSFAGDAFTEDMMDQLVAGVQMLANKQ